LSTSTSSHTPSHAYLIIYITRVIKPK
jgi:hypothetical protein